MSSKLPNETFIPYDEVVKQKLIKEGDVLMFRGTGIISYSISKMGMGLHSHAAMASWHDNMIECVEFREFKGGRSVSLQSQVNRTDCSIDVFRPKRYFPVLQENGQYRNVWYAGDSASEQMRRMTGLPYGWKRIWLLAKYYVPFIRWRTKPNFDDKATNGNIYPVCSTAVAASVRIGGYGGQVDLCPLKSDPSMTPPDVARSPVLDYVFTLQR